MAMASVVAASAHGAAAQRETGRARLTTGAGSLVLVEESHDLPLVDVSVVLRTGSWYDPPGKEGLARLTARAVRMGTRRMRAPEVEEAIDAMGASLGIETAPSYVRFSGSVIRRNLGPFLSLLGRLLGAPAFRAADLAQVERETLADIVEGRDDDRSLAGQQFRRFLFAGHRSGRPVIGTTSSVRAIDREDVTAFYEAHFVAGNLILGFAGDLTAAEARALVQRHFASLRPGSAPPTELVEPTPPRGRRVLVVDKPERTQTQIYIGSLGTAATDPDHFPLLVANTVFGGTFTARLMRAVRSERGWSYGAYSRLGLDRTREAFSLWTFPAASDAVPCIALELELLSSLVTEGLTAAELRFAQSYLANSNAFEIDTAQKRLDQRIDVELYGLPRDYFDTYVARVRAVTLAQANEALRRRLSADDLVVVLVATASELRPRLAELPGIASVEVVPFDAD